MTDLRTAAQQALEALESVEWYGAGSGWMVDADAIEGAITALKAALAEPTGKDSLQVEPTVAENATVQQQIEDTPPSDYRRGYWDGFRVGKREGRIAAEDALAEPTVPSDCADSHQPGCDRCRSPLWCGDKCSVCGAVYANK